MINKDKNSSLKVNQLQKKNVTTIPNSSCEDRNLAHIRQHSEIIQTAPIGAHQKRGSGSYIYEPGSSAMNAYVAQT